MAKAKESLKQAGMVIGISEALVLAGCEGPDSSESVDSSVEPQSVATEVMVGRKELKIPLRISRAFFESQVLGDLLIQAGDGTKIAETRSEVRYHEGAPLGAPPEEGYLADFRDRPGYATFRSTSGPGRGEPVRLRLTIAPDVSSFDVTPEKVTVEGVGALIEAHLKAQAAPGCGDKLEKIEFADAIQEGDDSFRVSFRAYPTAQPGSGESCAMAPIQVTMKLVSG